MGSDTLHEEGEHRRSVASSCKSHQEKTRWLVVIYRRVRREPGPKFLSGRRGSQFESPKLSASRGVEREQGVIFVVLTNTKTSAQRWGFTDPQDKDHILNKAHFHRQRRGDD